MLFLIFEASCREPAVFQEAGKLHLTVVMLSLLDENEKTKAANALEAVVNNRAKLDPYSLY